MKESAEFWNICADNFPLITTNRTAANRCDSPVFLRWIYAFVQINASPAMQTISAAS